MWTLLLATPHERLIARFRLQRAAELAPRYNIAASESVAAIRENVNQERELALLRWGLVPSTTKDTKNGYRMINARAETLSQRPAFRAAFAHRRCLIPADGFYEWQQTIANSPTSCVPEMKTRSPLPGYGSGGSGATSD
jgi:putative SOS response-associated peptidase YedK